MKKKKMIFAAFAVSMAMCVPFAACGGEGESDQTVDQVQTMVEDEETWDAAFADLDYVNFSIRFHYVSDLQGTVENYIEISENAIYYNLQDLAECYTAKNDDGSYSTYIRNLHEGGDNFTLLNDTSDSFFVVQRRAVPRPISFADYFEMFTYDGDTKTYRCADEISCKFIVDYAGHETELGIICSNIVVATENNRIVAISADYSSPDPDVNLTNAHFEYFNIGRTTVTIPQEVIDNAVAEEIDSGENTPADGNGDSGENTSAESGNGDSDDNNTDSAENLG